MTQKSPILTKLISLLATVDKMSLRERLLVFGAAMMLLGSLWYLGLMQPLTKQVTKNRTEITSLQERTKTTNQNLEVQALQISGSETGDREKFERVQRRLDEMNERLGGYAAELIDPAEMSRVLQSVLKEQSKLRLILARNISHGAMSASAEAQTTTFYRHGLEIESLAKDVLDGAVVEGAVTKRPGGGPASSLARKGLQMSDHSLHPA